MRIHHILEKQSQRAGRVGHSEEQREIEVKRKKSQKVGSLLFMEPIKLVPRVDLPEAFSARALSTALMMGDTCKGHAGGEPSMRESDEERAQRAQRGKGEGRG
jgi:hypothetical protein